ncbi:uncharacterized protein BJX67DRAFT_387508 [Aspergillus lucknowensis]|uniref:Sugar phosphate transporter domain-containing protein n=1 Tax=Aspergillus lucknowensis TaxID=176173 RepID=A0ABR4LUL6_9EURO
MAVSKAGHLVLQTTRRRPQVFILLALILLIILYPFRFTLLPQPISSIPGSLLDSNSINAQPGSHSPSQVAAATEITAATLLSRPLSKDQTSIPKIIHQTWFPAGTNMSESARAWVQTVKKHHPDWEYVLWDDESNEALVRKHVPWFLETYKALPKEINRADMARNLYMFIFGGMYADVDTESLRPVEPLFAAHDVALEPHLASLSASSSPGRVQRAFMGRMAHTLDPEGLGAVPNGWMASPPGHPFWLMPVLAVLENPKGDGSNGGIIENWIFWSNLTILFNKWILESTPFPILLTTWHLLFATLATQFLAHTTPLLSARCAIPMTRRLYMARIAPIALLYSASLVCSNSAYVFLNVAVIQMLKAAGPVITLLTSALWSLTTLTPGKLLNIVVIAASVAVTVSGEIRFSGTGVALQLAALVFDANRLVMMENENENDTSNTPLKMDPLVSLYYTAPVCFLVNAILAWKAEGQDGLIDAIIQTGPGTLLANALVGFMLNVAVFTLIGKTSGLTMTLVSIPKNILLIGASAVLWGTTVSLVQGVGYAVALGGLVVYSSFWGPVDGWCYFLSPEGCV